MSEITFKRKNIEYTFKIPNDIKDIEELILKNESNKDRNNIIKLWNSLCNSFVKQYGKRFHEVDEKEYPTIYSNYEIKEIIYDFYIKKGKKLLNEWNREEIEIKFNFL